MYSAGWPATLAFSGRPWPLGRWQKPQASTSGARPLATTGGIGGWLSGCQSGGSKRFRNSERLKVTSLPGTRSTSPGSGGGPPSPGGGAFSV